MSSIATPPEVAERSSARQRGRRSATFAPYTPLYCTVNGFSLGAFIAGAQLPMAAPRYPAMRQRVHEFLDEVEIPLRWPANHADYVAQSTTLHARLLEALRERSVALHELAGIGMMAVLLATGFPSASAAHVPQRPLDFSFPLLYREEWNDNTRSSARYQLLNPSR